METSEKLQDISIFSHTHVNKSENTDLDFYREVGKRLFDIFLATLTLPLALPFLGILAILIKLSSKGPVIYRSKRIGKDGKYFDCLKLRTMYSDADQKLNALLEKSPEMRGEWERDQKLKSDPRVTKIGKFIRMLSLDEIPQIFNVFKGEMSLVGPRPIVRSEVAKYGESFEYYCSVRPGITGIWQTNGRNDTSYESRVRMDVLYAKSNNFIMDLIILYKTIPAAITKKGAY